MRLEDPSDLTVPFQPVGWSAAAGNELSDTTVQFRAVGRPVAAGDELSDATVQFRVISLPTDPITPFRVISQPTHGPGQVNGTKGSRTKKSDPLNPGRTEAS